ncbi:Os01g0719125 [Oryza sativa Japonica Group]|uniref:Os01g0719125 protein n=1 Tax=Oryza sativa subsp. japonica TaxID=39947 RepID=A0A0P0V7I7_ORYSJ|nr:hypothetical protein EE612_005377 [Oryza sativa]BAS74059.1 Os01g0719125 [Oryza sativa Japonica Group]
MAPILNVLHHKNYHVANTTENTCKYYAFSRIVLTTECSQVLKNEETTACTPGLLYTAELQANQQKTKAMSNSSSRHNPNRLITKQSQLALSG